ncbi:MAG TPA: hypothetical protein ENI05_13490 [Porticoccus sp.]|nr:hypothetical protein [Porticoccus sp.]
MSELREVRLIGTTETDGSLTVTAPYSIFGTLHSIRWVDGDFVNGVDAVISMQGTSAPSEAYNVLTLTDADDDATYYPKELAHDNAGATLPQGTDKTAVYKDPLLVGVPRLVVASGGDGKTGGCFLYYHK